VTEVNLTIPYFEYADPAQLHQRVAMAAGLRPDELADFQQLRRSIDARNRNIRFNLKVAVFVKGESIAQQHPNYQQRHFEDVSKVKHHAVVIGAGPAGLFAALRLIELGIRPIVLERGKDVRARRRDLAAINRDHIVNSESNYCFGEGGAGTYSDGKLYTRSTKRGDVNRILSTFVQFGADADILVDAHPHIGTNRLPAIITAIREQIIQSGGEVRFEAKLTDILLNSDQVSGVHINDSESIAATTVILATGHSARDIYTLLHAKGMLVEAKPFAMGVRVEHPQELINGIQYHGAQCDMLPPAAYSWVEQVRGRGVYSFCMCPGGIIAPCATSPGEVVTNGWSPSKRNNPFANSGIVVPVEPEDYRDFAHFGPLAGMKYQEHLERLCCTLGGSSQTAPAQRLTDLVVGKTSQSLPTNSYQPGTVAVNLAQELPTNIVGRLRDGFRTIGGKMRGYLTEEAVAVAIESRTSSPVRIPRGADGQHPQIKGLYPCGEGGGFAGGIVSAAIDGEWSAESVGHR